MSDESTKATATGAKPSSGERSALVLEKYWAKRWVRIPSLMFYYGGYALFLVVGLFLAAGFAWVIWMVIRIIWDGIVKLLFGT